MSHSLLSYPGLLVDQVVGLLGLSQFFGHFLNGVLRISLQEQAQRLGLVGTEGNGVAVVLGYLG